MTLEQNREIDRIASAFEQALRRGESPRIEDALSQISRHDGLEIRGRLLRELLATEWEHCRQSGESLDEEAWSARFPEAIAFIREQGTLFRSRGSLSETAQPAGQDSVASAPQPAEAAPLEALAPLSLTEYELQRRLGRGGQGEVHLARQRSLNRQVAIKLLRAEAEGDPQHARRFLRGPGRSPRPGTRISSPSMVWDDWRRADRSSSWNSSTGRIWVSRFATANSASTKPCPSSDKWPRQSSMRTAAG